MSLNGNLVSSMFCNFLKFLFQIREAKDVVKIYIFVLLFFITSATFIYTEKIIWADEHVA